MTFRGWGWKTNTGVGLMLAGLLLDIFGVNPLSVVDRLFGLGQLVAFFGLRDAIRSK